MPYHVLFSTPQGTHWWANLSWDALVQEIVIPFINRQTVPVNHGGGRAIMNLGAAVYLRVLKTERDLGGGGWWLPLQIRLRGTECTQEVIDRVRLDRSTQEAQSLLQAAVAPSLRQVFVVMRFGDRTLDSAYAGVIKPVIERYDYRALRIDEIQDSGRITDQILHEIARSEITLCDLSGERPNCYYEAGFAHALGRELILTIRSGDPIHFDLAGYRFIVWDTEQQLREQLDRRIAAMASRRSG